VFGGSGVDGADQKPLEEDHTPGTVEPFQVSLVEPVAYPLSYLYFEVAQDGTWLIKSRNRAATGR
jgi:hypothetical protein